MIRKAKNSNLIRAIFYIVIFISTFLVLNYTKYLTVSGGTEDLSSLELIQSEDGGVKIVEDRFYTFTQIYTIEKESENELKKSEDSTETTEKIDEPVEAMFYRVKRGDTLYEIAKAIGQDLDVLIANNPEVKDGRIYVDQKLKILSQNGIHYNVERGDTLIGISKKYDVKLADILSANDLNDTRIYAGQKLFLKNPNLDVIINPGSQQDRLIRNFKNSMKWPVAWQGVTSPFGQRFHPVLKKYIVHKGVDLRAATGTNLYASENGRVSISGWLGGYGRIIEITHANGYKTRMAHLDKIYVNNGEEVTRGQLIGKTGQSGRVTGPHLHFEVIKNGVELDPTRFR